jgi:hypothetical protein
MLREDLLNKAAEITKGARQEHYGTPEDNFKRIAEYWQTYLRQTQLEDGPITIHSWDVATMMILMKVARLAADYLHDDSWLDIAGYAACGSECAENDATTWADRQGV